MLTVVNVLGRISLLAHHSAAGHVEVATLSGFAGGLAAFMIFGRFRQDGDTAWLLASAGLLLLGANNVIFAVPTSGSTTPFVTWLTLVVGLAGALLFTMAAFTRSVVVHRRNSWTVRLGVGLVAGGLLTGVMIWAFRATLPVARELSLPRSILLVQATAGVALAVAAFGFRHRAGVKGDELAMWLAAAGILGSLAYANYLLPRSDVFYGRVSVGGYLFLAACGLSVMGALRDSVRRQAKVAEERADAERRRLARDLHDGIAQELAFIAMQARHRQQVSGESWIDDIVDAADRALAESRGTLRQLTSTSASLGETLHAAAEDVALRAGARVRLEADDAQDAPSAEAQEALVRIVREAVTNAVRHGKASAATLSLRHEQGALRLTIADNGVGFDPSVAARRSSGFGLGGMEARAVELGGRVQVRSQPGAGASVDVILP
jgi:signal transduction histidine kinase